MSRHVCVAVSTQALVADCDMKLIILIQSKQGEKTSCTLNFLSVI